MTLTTTDIKKVREIVREETADMRADIVDIRENMLTKKDAEKFLTKKDAEKFLNKKDAEKFLNKKDAEILVENASQRAANFVIEKMQDEFRAFYDKLKFIDDRSIKNEFEIKENRSQIELNSMKILYNSNRIKALEEK